MQKRKPYYKSDKKVFYNNRYYNDDLIFIEQAGTTYPDAEYYICRDKKKEYTHSHLYVLEYVVSGKGYINSEDEHYEVSAGDFYFINRYTSHEYYPDPEDPFKKLWINVSGRFINYMTMLYNMSDHIIIRHVDVEYIFNDILSTLSERDITENARNKKIVALVSELLYCVNEPEIMPEQAPNSFLRIKNYVNLYSDTNITVESIAERYFLSTSTVHRLFIENTGMSPKQYILIQRIKKAKDLLETTDLPVKSIATLLGFCDSPHFSHTFSQITGMSPNSYREKTLQNIKSLKKSD